MAITEYNRPQRLDVHARVDNLLAGAVGLGLGLPNTLPEIRCVPLSYLSLAISDSTSIRLLYALNRSGRSVSLCFEHPLRFQGAALTEPTFRKTNTLS